MFSLETKNHNVSQFLKDCSEKVDELEQDFTVERRLFYLLVKCFICDAPARSFIKQTKGHGGYNGCDNGIQEEYYLKYKMIFPEISAKPRADESFVKQLCESS